MPLPVVHAMAIIKKCCAKYNKQSGRLKSELADAIMLAADEVVMGKHDAEFPLVVFQTGSGTQSNMNMNEVPPFLGSDPVTTVVLNLFFPFRFFSGSCHVMC